MASAISIFTLNAQTCDRNKHLELSDGQYLEDCCNDPMMYRSAVERMVEAIAAPELGGTSKDCAFSRYYTNRAIKIGVLSQRSVCGAGWYADNFDRGSYDSADGG